MTSRELQATWDRASHWYDRAVLLLELFLFRRLRHRLLSRAQGRILEIGVGSGINLPLYPRSARLTAVDLSAGMLLRARPRFPEARFALMDAAALGFRDSSFDTVVSTLATCTFPDPVRALQEMARVCTPQGRILLLEHGRSTNTRLARLQDRTAPGHAAHLGCWWNREPLEGIAQAGLTIVSASRTALGMVHVIELRGLGTEPAPRP